MTTSSSRPLNPSGLPPRPLDLLSKQQQGLTTPNPPHSTQEPSDLATTPFPLHLLPRQQQGEVTLDPPMASHPQPSTRPSPLPGIPRLFESAQTGPSAGPSSGASPPSTLPTLMESSPRDTFTRPSPLPNSTAPLGLGAGEAPCHISGSGFLPGRHVWAIPREASVPGGALVPLGTPLIAGHSLAAEAGPGEAPCSRGASSPEAAAPEPCAPLPPLNFPHFRVKAVLSNDSPPSGSPQAEQSRPQQVPEKGKRAASALRPLPLQRPKKRGRPSRKDKAEAAAAAAAAANPAASPVPGDASGAANLDRASRKLPHILPKMSWQVDCAAESAAVMLRQHKAKQLSSCALNSALVAPAVVSPLGGMPAFTGDHSNINISINCAFSGSFHGVSSVSCLADARTEATYHGLPFSLGNPREAPETSVKEPIQAKEIDMPMSKVSGVTGRGSAAAAPSPKSVPALDWLMERLQAQPCARTAASVISSCQEQADESSPTKLAPLRTLSAKLSLPKVGSSSSLHQLSSSGGASSRASRPPASVVAAASELLARHCGLDRRLAPLPNVLSNRGCCGSTVIEVPHKSRGCCGTSSSVGLQVTAVEDSPRPPSMRLNAAELMTVQECKEDATCENLDLDLHL